MKEHTIPIIVGVTGHRNPREDAVPEIRKLVKSELEKLKTEYPNSEIVMLNSLAAGADTICAEEAVNLGIRLICPIPMDVEEYSKDFEGEDLMNFERFLGLADDVFVSPASETSGAGRNFCYRQAGIYVAAHSHVLIALWDGSPAQEGGCGTAEAVDFMLNGTPCEAASFRAESDGAVIHINTPRVSSDINSDVSVSLIENKEGSLAKILKKTDEFNREVKNQAFENGYPLLDGETDTGKRGVILENIYKAADAMALAKQQSYMTVLKVISVVSVLLVLCYLLYDEAALNTCLIGFGIFAVLYAVFFRIADNADHHESYLEYRALAESMRVQFYMNTLGITDCACDYYTWAQKCDFTWISKAIRGVLSGSDENNAVTQDVVKEYWIEGQLNYHKNAFVKDGSQLRSMENISRLMLILTGLTWLAIIVLEYGFNNLMTVPIGAVNLRILLKILWGCLSAVTVFATSYYGKLSLARKCGDHDRMIQLFENALQRYEKYPESREEIFRQLAKEEIIENGNWVSYCMENKPDFSF